MITNKFQKDLHRRLAQVAVGASALRNTGASGVIEQARNYFEHQIDLQAFITVLAGRNNFLSFLDYHTVQLINQFPQKARHWGVARKGLNLFFRDVVYNRFIWDYFLFPTSLSELNSFISPLEVPLDRSVGEGLIADSFDPLPPWKGVKYLQETESDVYQTAAKAIASQENIPRVHLDLKYYRPDKYQSSEFIKI